MAGAVTTIDSVIKEFLSGRGDTSKHGYTRFLQMAISGLKEMNYDVSGMPSYLNVSLGEDAVIPIPPDCINVIGIHFNYGGRWISSAKENFLAISTDMKLWRRKAQMKTRTLMDMIIITTITSIIINLIYHLTSETDNLQGGTLITKVVIRTRTE